MVQLGIMVWEMTFLFNFLFILIYLFIKDHPFLFNTFLVPTVSSFLNSPDTLPEQKALLV